MTTDHEPTVGELFGGMLSKHNEAMFMDGMKSGQSDLRYIAWFHDTEPTCPVHGPDPPDGEGLALTLKAHARGDITLAPDVLARYAARMAEEYTETCEEARYAGMGEDL